MSAHPPVEGIKDPELMKIVGKVRRKLAATRMLLNRHRTDKKEDHWIDLTMSLVDESIFQIDHHAAPNTKGL